MRVNDIPDLRNEWWFDEWMVDERLPSLNSTDEFDWTAELGGWDMMKLFDRHDDDRRIWVYVQELSGSFN